jgi:uncharacterized membrane protein
MMVKNMRTRGVVTAACLGVAIAMMTLSAIVESSDRLSDAEQRAAAFLKYCYGCDNKGWNECAACNGTGYSKFDLYAGCVGCGGSIDPPRAGRGRNPCGVPGCPYRR